MARKRLKSATDQRPFVMVYHDFLESDILSGNEKILFIALKKYADSRNQCYPSIRKLSDITGLSRRTVQECLKTLEQKNIIAKNIRFREDGGQSSNLYTLYDYHEIWQVDSSEEVSEIIEEHEEQRLIKLLEAKGYKIIKEKELTSSPPKVKEVSAQINPFSVLNNISNTEKCQSERYSEDDIKELYEYSAMINDYPEYRDQIDITMRVLYNTLNTTKQNVRISGEDKPTKIVMSQLLRLNKESIIHAIQKYNQIEGKIKAPLSYMLTILYRASDDYKMDIKNKFNMNE